MCRHGQRDALADHGQNCPWTVLLFWLMSVQYQEASHAIPDSSWAGWKKPLRINCQNFVLYTWLLYQIFSGRKKLEAIRLIIASNSPWKVNVKGNYFFPKDSSKREHLFLWQFFLWLAMQCSCLAQYPQPLQPSDFYGTSRRIVPKPLALSGDQSCCMSKSVPQGMNGIHLSTDKALRTMQLTCSDPNPKRTTGMLWVLYPRACAKEWTLGRHADLIFAQ